MFKVILSTLIITQILSSSLTHAQTQGLTPVERLNDARFALLKAEAELTQLSAELAYAEKERQYGIPGIAISLGTLGLIKGLGESTVLGSAKMLNPDSNTRIEKFLGWLKRANWRTRLVTATLTGFALFRWYGATGPAINSLRIEVDQAAKEVAEKRKFIETVLQMSTYSPLNGYGSTHDWTEQKSEDIANYIKGLQQQYKDQK